MSDHPRFLIAKYIPDVFRNEPRNIGVVLWTPDGVVARFLGEKPDAPGEVDDENTPEFVRSKHAYREWVRYWRREMARATTTSSDCLDSLCVTGASNYLLADGRVVSDLKSSPPPDLLDRLFDQMVGSPPVEVARTTADVPPLPPTASFPNDRRKRTIPLASDRRVKNAAEARKTGERHRLIDPTSCERDFSDDETDFMKAMDRYKRDNRRPFPTWNEVFELLRHLGYRKVAEPTEVPKPISTEASVDSGTG